MHRTPATLAGDEFVALVSLSDHDGLNHTLRTDRLGQGLQRLGVELASRLKATGADRLDRDIFQAAFRFGLLAGDLDAAGQQRVQPAAQAPLFRRHQAAFLPEPRSTSPASAR